MTYASQDKNWLVLAGILYLYLICKSVKATEITFYLHFKQNVHSFGPAIQCLGTYPSKLLPDICKDSHCSIVCNSEKLKQPECPSLRNSFSFMIHPYYGLLFSRSKEKDISQYTGMERPPRFIII